MATWEAPNRVRGTEAEAIEPIKIDRPHKPHRSNTWGQCGLVWGDRSYKSMATQYPRLFARQKPGGESPAWQSCFSIRNRRDRLSSNAFWSTTRLAAHACSSINSFSFPSAWRSFTARRENAAGWCGNVACASAWHSRYPSRCPVAGLPSRSARGQRPAFALWAPARQPSPASRTKAGGR